MKRFREARVQSNSVVDISDVRRAFISYISNKYGLTYNSSVQWIENQECPVDIYHWGNKEFVDKIILEYKPESRKYVLNACSGLSSAFEGIFNPSNLEEFHNDIDEMLRDLDPTLLDLDRKLESKKPSKKNIKESESESESESECVAFDFRDDMIHAIMDVFEKYNFKGGNHFGKEDLDSAIEFLELHDYFEDPEFFE